MRFAEQVILVTGAGSGIGRAAASAFAREGGRVYANDREAGRIEALAADQPGHIIPLPFDVTDDQAFQEAFARIDDEQGKLDVLFNNAGAAGAPARIDEIEMAEWDRTLALLLRSVAAGIRFAAPLMARGGGGAVVNTASVAAFGSGFAPVAYSVAKAGVLHLTKLAGAQLARQGVRVNAVCPGLILTGIFTESYRDAAPALAAEVDAYMQRTAVDAQPLARPGLPEDVAEAVLFLASDAARFVTGTHLMVDGGITVGARHSWDPALQRPDDHPLNKVAVAMKA
ncbi:SDR family oxidoreductase [Sphingomonas ginkgonis]|uniref:SDR family oxidoreductase n=1 Tax=Sphingomonas ginkgonis TaxID=2315330 RepID=A0A3R9XA11_9SPHN|nr:SDR family oxidoreductase [Sphingomonas ginkgonis]